MEDCLQDIAVDVGDVSVLPVKVDTIGRAIPMPKAQRAEADGWHGKLLIERTISGRFSSGKSAKSIARVSHEGGEVSAVGLSICYYRQIIVVKNYPRWKLPVSNPSFCIAPLSQGVGVEVAVAVGDAVGVAVGVGDSVAVAVAVRLGVPVAVGVGVGDGHGTSAAVTARHLDCRQGCRMLPGMCRPPGGITDELRECCVISLHSYD